MPLDPSPLQACLDAAVARGEPPGYVAVVRRGRQRVVLAAGVADLDSGMPMRPDTVMRIASLSKPVGAVLTMQLVEAGVLALDDAIGRWLPELASPRVLSRPDAELDNVVDLEREVTVRDLLTNTAGFGVGREVTPLAAALAERGLGPGALPPTLPPDEVVARLSELPLGFQPGAGWLYHTCSEVLGVLLERASGRRLDALVHGGLGEPLGLADLDFFAHDVTRLATSYLVAESGVSVLDPQQGRFVAEPAFRSLGAGLVCTAPEYLTVLDEIGSPSVLSPADAALIRAPALTEQQRRSAGDFLDPGYSYGLQVQVKTEPAGGPGGVGRFGWTGGTGVGAYADPRVDVSAVLFTQWAIDSPGQPRFATEFWDLVAAVTAPG